MYLFSAFVCVQYAIFEPGTRNTGTAIAGKNIANPIAMLNASVDMLEHLGHQTHANIINKAIERTISEDRIHTPGIDIHIDRFDIFQLFKFNTKINFAKSILTYTTSNTVKSQ